MENLLQNRTWILIKQPAHKSVIQAKFIFKVKVRPNSSIDKYKAHFVVLSYSQQFGEDFTETYTPMVMFKNLHTILTFTCTFNLKIHSMDIMSAFLHTDLSKEIYVNQPEGYINLTQPNHVCKLNKSLYGLKQAPYKWNHTINSQLHSRGFKPLKCDPCIYVLHHSNGIAIITIHVNDCTITASPALLPYTKDSLLTKFKMEDLSETTSMLSMEVIWRHMEGKLYLRMQGYMKQILSCFNMDSCLTVNLPASEKLSLPKLSQTMLVNQSLPYCKVIGMLLYLALWICPDIYYVVHYLTSFGYLTVHWQAVKQVLWYLQGTTDLAICYDWMFVDLACKTSLILTITCDVNHALMNQEDWKLISTFTVLLARGLIAWLIKTQQCVALSSTQAELNMISHAVRQVLYMRQMFYALKILMDLLVYILNDNQGVILTVQQCKGAYTGSKKHYDVKIKHAHNLIQAGMISIQCHWLQEAL